jgi:hypothetical protein
MEIDDSDITWKKKIHRHVKRRFASVSLSTQYALTKGMCTTMKSTGFFLLLFSHWLSIFHNEVDGFSAESGSRRVFVSTPVSRFPKRSVADCMTGLEDVTALAPMMSTDEAMATLLVSGLSGAPVVDRDRKLVGVVSSFDFLQKEAFEGALLPMEGSRANVAKYVQAAQKICGQVVSDIMTPTDDVRTLLPKIESSARRWGRFARRMART